MPFALLGGAQNKKTLAIVKTKGFPQIFATTKRQAYRRSSMT
jgi:hypothetical protein